MCKEPIEFEKLTVWWLGELAPAEAEALEAHLFGCAHCTGRAEWLAALGEGVRAAVRAGNVHSVVSAPFLEAMKGAGMRLREYRVANGGSVDCTIRDEDDAVVSRLAAPLAGVKRLDVLQLVEGMPARRVEDVPFDAAAGEVVVLPSATLLRRLPRCAYRMQLVAVDEGREEAIGEYAFLHTPSGPA